MDSDTDTQGECHMEAQRHTDTEIGSPLKTETEVGVMLPQAREYLGLSETGRGKEGVSGESTALSTP